MITRADSPLTSFVEYFIIFKLIDNKCFGWSTSTHYYVKDNNFLSKIKDSRGIVVELKYPSLLDSKAVRIIDHFPFRLSRMSKYISGIELLNT